VSKITLDRLERITQSVTPAPGSGVVPVSNLGLISKNEFDNLGNITKSIDALNNATSYTYDDLNRIVTISEPPPISGQGTFNTTIGYTANSIGWSTTTTDPSGRTAIVQADMLGRTTNVSGTAQPSSSIKYWMDGNVKSTMDELQRSTNYYYDQRGRLTATETPPADASTFVSSLTTTGYTSFSYMLDSLVSAVTDPMNRTTNYQYDVGGRLEQATQPDPDGAGPLTASFNKVVRDSLGNVRSKIDGRSQTTSYTQDAWFRNVTETDPRNAVTSTAYDVFGNVTSVTDPLNNITSYIYNKLNQVTTETKGIYGSRTYSYDSVGNTKQLTDRNGRVTSYNYDNRYRLTNETWNPVAPVRTLSYTYDTSDRMTGVVDSDVLAPSFEFAYDARSQLQAERQYGSSYLLGKSVNFDRKFDSVGNEVKLEANIGGTISISPTLITFSGGIWDFRTNYAYDGRDRLTSITQSNRAAGTQTNTTAPKSVAMVYNAASQITDVFRYSSLSPATANLEAHTRSNFDGAGRMVSITHSKSAIGTGLNWDGTSASPTVDTVAAYFMNYDAANRVTSLSSRADGFKSNFTYDNSNQATNTSSTQIAGLAMPFTPTSENYGLDSNGNRTGSANASQSSSGSHNRLQADGTYSYLYDNEGNVTRRTKLSDLKVTDYTWDYRNRLTTVTEKISASATTFTKKTEYTYDAFDQRTAKRVDVDGNGTWDRYEVFSWADGQEVMRWVDSDGQATAQTLRLTNRYLWSDAVDRLLSDEQYLNNTGMPITAITSTAVAGETFWALNDNLGSVRDLIDNNGVVRQHVVLEFESGKSVKFEEVSKILVIPAHDSPPFAFLYGEVCNVEGLVFVHLLFDVIDIYLMCEHVEQA
jgi:YD repeat-containing protein